MRVILIKTDHTYQIIEHPIRPTLKQLQDYVKGDIEYIHLKDNIGYYVNENKFIDNTNVLATTYWFDCLNFMADAYINGSVLIIGVDEEGEVIGLTDAQIKDFEHFVKGV